MSDLFSYAGKRVVLTGGTTGVGAAAVELLAEIKRRLLERPQPPRYAIPPAYDQSVWSSQR